MVRADSATLCLFSLMMCPFGANEGERVVMTLGW